uniref:Uncharacterized protein n=1 Tax=Zonotrichia albicollis TaxID=44394 RepID=A0A8D2M7C8_ZONAL
MGGTILESGKSVRNPPQWRRKMSMIKSFLSYKSHSSWSLTEMATVAFFIYPCSVKCAVFLLWVSFITMMVRCTPCEQHKKFCPPCEFVLGKSLGNISKYDGHVQKLKNPAETITGTVCRMQSCERWLLYARGANPDLLVSPEPFFTGN